MMPHPYPPGAGWIEVITGCMFSGKTEELLRRIRRAQIARQRVVVFKPRLDVRYAEDAVVSHNDARIPCVAVATVADIRLGVGDADVVGIDEAQFFDDDLPRVCSRLATSGKRVIVAGLDMDFRGIPFGPMPTILAIAEKVEKLSAICSRCGAPAAYTQRLTAAAEQVVVGAADVYEARCRLCHEPEGAARKAEPWLLPPLDGAGGEAG